MEHTLERILGITIDGSAFMSDKEKLARIEALATAVLTHQHERRRLLDKMAREAQEIGPYDHE